jgi:hypothetical protein
MPRPFVFAALLAALLILPFRPAQADYRFGEEQEIHFLQDVTLKGANNEALYLGYMTKTQNFIAGYSVEDAGYVLGVKGESKKYCRPARTSPGSRRRGTCLTRCRRTGSASGTISSAIRCGGCSRSWRCGGRGTLGASGARRPRRRSRRPRADDPRTARPGVHRAAARSAGSTAGSPSKTSSSARRIALCRPGWVTLVPVRSVT